MIDLIASCGGGNSNINLPSPPSKGARNTTDVAADFPTGITSGSNGRYKYSYQFWDVSSVAGLTSHSFGIGTGDATWSSSLGMALRNDTTGSTVWTKAYSTLGDSGPQGVTFDIASGFAYVFVTDSATSKLRLWRIVLSTGAATKLADAAISGFPTGGGSASIQFARFVDSNNIEFMFWAGANSFRVCKVNISTGGFTVPTVVVPWGSTLGGEQYSSQNSGSSTATVQWVTADKRAAISFTPSQLLDLPTAQSGTNGGDRGAIRTVIVYRGFGRAVLCIPDPLYQIPYRADDSSSPYQTIVTDNTGVMANVKSKTQYIPAWDGRFDFYDAADFDRWIHEIADNAGLPAGTPMW